MDKMYLTKDELNVLYGWNKIDFDDLLDASLIERVGVYDYTFDKELDVSVEYTSGTTLSLRNAITKTGKKDITPIYNIKVDDVLYSGEGVNTPAGKYTIDLVGALVESERKEKVYEAAGFFNRLKNYFTQKLTPTKQ